MVDPTPTVGFNCGKFRVSQGTARGHSFTVWDVGGQECFRMLWPTYLKNAVAMVFVIDASEPKRFEEAKVELDAALLTISSQTKLPVIIIANKQDKPGALDAEQTLAKFSKTPNNQEIFRVLPCCAVTGEGVENIFSEVLSAIQALKK
uniref:ADP-ribosylation factor n=1 Tax=Panagrolaimus sp. JU765 TaxID=591449 RepID=A0AC34QHV9_9BILA